MIVYLSDTKIVIPVCQAFSSASSVPLRSWGRGAVYLNTVACESNYIEQIPRPHPRPP